jgi:hypothetical protein
MDFFTQDTTWLFLAYTLGTGIGWYLSKISDTKKVVADMIDSLIEQNFLKTKGHGDNVEIIKHTEWCDDKVAE